MKSIRGNVTPPVCDALPFGNSNENYFELIVITFLVAQTIGFVGRWFKSCTKFAYNFCRILEQIL